MYELNSGVESYTCVYILLSSYEYLNYLVPLIFRVIKSRRMRWAGHIERMGERRGVHKVLVGKPEGKRPLVDPGLDGRIILRRIFRKWDVGLWTASSWLRVGTGDGRL